MNHLHFGISLVACVAGLEVVGERENGRATQAISLVKIFFRSYKNLLDIPEVF